MLLFNCDSIEENLFSDLNPTRKQMAVLWKIFVNDSEVIRINEFRKHRGRKVKKDDIITGEKAI